VTTAWANSSTFLKILSCPPPIYEFAPQMLPPPPILSLGAATGNYRRQMSNGSIIAQEIFYILAPRNIWKLIFFFSKNIFSA
jgi:hypothetical protein